MSGSAGENAGLPPERERLLAMRELGCEVYEYVCADEWDAEMFLQLQRTAQKLADLAGGIAGERGGR